ncbi:MAG: ankyrin repeat domain-containing protein [Gammaproteobacteria bacterium]
MKAMSKIKSTVVDNVAGEVRSQVGEEVGRAKNWISDWWTGKQTSDFIQKLLEEAVENVVLGQAFDEKKAGKLLKLLSKQMEIPTEGEKSKVKAKRILAIFANQLLPILLKSRLQYWEHVIDDRGFFERALGMSNDFSTYFSSKKTELKKIIKEALEELMSQITIFSNEELCEEKLSDINAYINEYFLRIENNIEELLLNPHLDTLLWQATQSGDLAKCYKAIALGANLSYQNKSDSYKSSLHIAAEKGHSQIVHCLLNIELPGQLVNVNVTDAYNRTPLLLAIINLQSQLHKLEPIVKQLCEAGADTNIVATSFPFLETNWTGWTPLHIMCYIRKPSYDKLSDDKHLTIVTRLLNKNANADVLLPLNSRKKWANKVPLHLAVQSQSLKLVEKLIEYKAFPFEYDAENKRPIDLALKKSPIYDLLKTYSETEKHHAIRKLRLAEISQVNKLLETRQLLFSDIENKLENVLGLFLQETKLSISQTLYLFSQLDKNKIFGLNLYDNKLDDYAASALANFISYNERLVVLDINQNHLNAVSAALLAGGLRKNTSLVHFNINCNPIGDTGFKAICESLMSNKQLSSFRCLYNTGIYLDGAFALLELICARKNIVDIDLSSLDDLSNQVRLPLIVKQLLMSAIDVNKAQKANGLYNSMELPSELKNQLIANATQEDCPKIIETLCVKGHLNALSWLLKSMPSDFVNQHKLLLTAVSAEKRSDEMVSRVLLASNVNVNTYDQDNNSALHLAIRAHAGRSVIDALINKGADINLPNSMKQTPLHLAVLVHHEEAIDILLNKSVSMNAQNLSGMSAFMLASMRSNQRIITKILSRPDLDVNLVDYQQRSALYLALLHYPKYHQDIVDLLIKRVDPGLLDKEGKTIKQRIFPHEPSESDLNGRELFQQLSEAEINYHQMISNGDGVNNLDDPKLITPNNSYHDDKIQKIRQWQDSDTKLEQLLAHFENNRDKNFAFYQGFFERYKRIYIPIYKNDITSRYTIVGGDELLLTDEKKVSRELKSTEGKYKKALLKLEKLRMQSNKKSRNDVEKYEKKSDHLKAIIDFLSIIAERISDQINITEYTREYGPIAIGLQPNSVVAALIKNSSILINKSSGPLSSEASTSSRELPSMKR